MGFTPSGIEREEPPQDGHATATLTPPTIEPISATDTGARVNFTDDPWWDDSSGMLLCWAAPAQPLTINWFRGPYTLTTLIGGGDSSPGFVPLEGTATSGTRQFFRFRVRDTAGMLSQAIHLHADVA